MDGLLRVSCATLCRIRREDGRYLVALNRARLEGGTRVWTPLGGGLEFTDEGIPARFAAAPERPDSRDLRLFMPPDRLPAFRSWFNGRTGRELTPYRELREELVDELRALPALPAMQVRFRLRRVQEHNRVTSRPGVAGEDTHYFIEVFDIEFLPGEARSALWAWSASEPLRWVTRGEIDAGRTSEGDAVDAVIVVA